MKTQIRIKCPACGMQVSQSRLLGKGLLDFQYDEDISAVYKVQ